MVSPFPSVVKSYYVQVEKAIRTLTFPRKRHANIITALNSQATGEKQDVGEYVKE